MKTVTEILRPILEKIHLDIFDPNELVSLAWELISNNIENENILILAGLDNEPKSEDNKLKFHYFELGLRDLGIGYLATKPKNPVEKALYITNAVLHNHLEPKSGLRLLVELCTDSQYDEQFMQFYVLYDEIDLYIHENTTLFRQQTGFENLDELIRNEFKKYKKLHTKETTSNI